MLLLLTLQLLIHLTQVRIQMKQRPIVTIATATATGKKLTIQFDDTTSEPSMEIPLCIFVISSMLLLCVSECIYALSCFCNDIHVFVF